MNVHFSNRVILHDSFQNIHWKPLDFITFCNLDYFCLWLQLADVLIHPLYCYFNTNMEEIFFLPPLAWVHVLTWLPSPSVAAHLHDAFSRIYFGKSINAVSWACVAPPRETYVCTKWFCYRITPIKGCWTCFRLLIVSPRIWSSCSHYYLLQDLMNSNRDFICGWCVQRSCSDWYISRGTL